MSAGEQFAPQDGRGIGAGPVIGASRAGVLQGKVAVITGGAFGIGRADVIAFCREGAHVVVADISTAGQAAADAEALQASYHQLDVASERGWRELLDGVVNRYGRLDILVNNAGVTDVSTPETVTADAVDRLLRVNVQGVIFGTKYALAAMRKTGAGSIINMSSITSRQPEPMVAAYCATKGAVEAYTRATAAHCVREGLKIRCNSVHPSAVETPMVRAVREEIAAKMSPGLPPPSRGENSHDPDDIARLVVYLASEESAAINGQAFAIDAKGGEPPWRMLPI